MAGKEQACPHCGSTEMKPIRFTWWGGFIGPWLLRYSRCRSCRRKFALRTGRHRRLAILIYNLFVFALGASLLYLVLRLVLRSVADAHAP